MNCPVQVVRAKSAGCWLELGREESQGEISGVIFLKIPAHQGLMCCPMMKSMYHPLAGKPRYNMLSGVNSQALQLSFSTFLRQNSGVQALETNRCLLPFMQKHQNRKLLRPFPLLRGCDCICQLGDEIWCIAYCTSKVTMLRICCRRHKDSTD